MQELTSKNYNDLSHWVRNPRTDPAGNFETNQLRASMLSNGYHAYEPMVVLPDGAVVQGNRRLSILADMTDAERKAVLGNELQVPCVIWTGTEDDAVLFALNDRGVGTSPKTVIDLKQAIVLLYQHMTGTKRSGMIEHLWINAPDILTRISPGCATHITAEVGQDGKPTGQRVCNLAGVKTSAGGVFQLLEKISKLPQPIITDYFRRERAGETRGKFWDISRINQYDQLRASLDGDTEPLIQRFEAEAANYAGPRTPKDTGPATKLMPGKLPDVIKACQSDTVRKLLGLFLPAPTGKDVARRDALAELRAIDEAVAMAESA
jgi:hypothetical protein